MDAGKDFDSSLPVKLSIQSKPTNYTLSLQSANSEINTTVASETLTIFPPVGGAFCGAMYGIYSFGSSEPVLDPSDFRAILIVDES